MFTFACENCGQRLKVEQDLAGHRGKCPRCGQAIEVPLTTVGAVVSSGMSPHPTTPTPRPIMDSEPILMAPSWSPELQIQSPNLTIQATPAPTTEDAEAAMPGPGPTSAEPVVASPIALAGYELLQELGRGGMGVVYKARQVGLNRLVALKMILAGAHAGPQEIARFRTEAAAAACLQHTNIVQIYEVGEQDGYPYFSLELVEGGSLADKLRGTPLSARQAAQLIATLAQAVHVAHLHGVVHRDLKPANVLLAKDGTPKIADFGLAKRLDIEAGQTQSGVIVGTPSYMAPEQAAGKVHAIGPASDVYALGAVLYEMLTGRPPFRAETPMDTVLQVMSEEPVPPRRLHSKVPRDLETICLKCLEKEPGRRYPSAKALADDVNCFLRDEPILARPMRGWERARAWAKRRPALAGLLAASVVLAVTVIVAGLSVFHGKELQRALNDTERARVAEQEQKKIAEAAVAVAATNLYINRIALAERALLAANVVQADQALDACLSDLRDWEWRYLKRVSHAELLTFRGHEDWVFSAAFSPDGKQVASGGLDKDIKLWDPATGQMLGTLRGHSSTVTSVAFGPGGKTLASGSCDGTVRVWDVATGQELQRMLAHADHVLSVAYSHDGELVASGSKDKTIKVWNARTGRELAVLDGHSDVVRSVAFDPRGERLASAGQDKTIRLWSVATRMQLHMIRGHSKEVLSVVFSPDGQQLASASRDKTVRVWNAETGQENFTLIGHTDAVSGVAFSPTGQRLASCGKVIKLWDLATGDEIFGLRGHAKEISSIAFSSDGRRLVSASEDQTVKVWDAWASPEGRVLLGHNNDVTCLNFSKDGTRLATGSDDKTVIVWDVATGSQLLTLEHGDMIRNVSFRPDGRHLVTVDRDGEVTIWNATDGEEVRTLEDHGTYAVYSPDGSRLAVASWEKDGPDEWWGLIKIHESDTGKELQRIRGRMGAAFLSQAGAAGRKPLHEHMGMISSMAFSPDGNLLATASDMMEIKIWDLGAETELLSIPLRAGSRSSGDRLEIVFSPDGERLASTWIAFGNDHEAAVWSARNGQQLFILQGQPELFTLAFTNPAGKRLAGACIDRTIKIWEANGGEEIFTLRGHADWVSCVAFSPDGHCLASGGRDKTVRIWDTLSPSRTVENAPTPKKLAPTRRKPRP